MWFNAPRVWRYNKQRRRFLGKRGVLVSWSVVRVAPEGMLERTPYVVGLVRVGKALVMAQLIEVEDVSRLRVGLVLIGRLRRLFDVDEKALLVYGIKFAPLRRGR